MKLLDITTRYFLLLIITLLLVWGCVLYFTIQNTVYNDTDEYLISKQYEIMESIKLNPNFVYEKANYKRSFRIKEITKSQFDAIEKIYPNGVFKDTMQFEYVEQENEPFRKFEFVFKLKNHYFYLEIFASLVNQEELLYTILVNLMVLLLILVVLVVVMNRQLLMRLWQPFYENIALIKQFRLDSENVVQLKSSKVMEFEDLRLSLLALMENNHKVYQSQKQFIENASHELQTPLAIASNKLQLLIEKPELNEEESKLIEAVFDSLNRASRLNKALLLLSKIENKQFSDINNIDINQLIQKQLHHLEEMILHKGIEVCISPNEKLEVQMNPDLAVILISNLITNAIYHNFRNGTIEIEISNRSLFIRNTGHKLGFAPSQLFERFQKNAGANHSNGLGLSIVKGICQFYQFDLEYTSDSEFHQFSLSF